MFWKSTPAIALAPRRCRELFIGGGFGGDLAAGLPAARREVEEVVGHGADLEPAQVHREALDPLVARDVEFHGVRPALGLSRSATRLSQLLMGWNCAL